MYLKANLENIKERIKIAAEKSNRKSDDIILIGVTKTIDVDTINKSIDYGIENIGENKVQEILKKYDNINKNVKWHMIGHLQTNKVKYIIDKVQMIHSLDRISLAKELQKRATQHDINVNALIQVNISLEKSKFGIKKEEIYDFIKEIEKFDRIKIKGLMTMAPFLEEKNETRFVFRGLKELYEKLKEMKFRNVEMKYLSMGMTNDFEVAIEEGANMVRIGTGIYGKRNY